MNERIEVWFDETSDPSNPVWCVSLCKATGDEIKLLSSHTDKEEAIVVGRAYAKHRGMKLIEVGTFGLNTEHYY